MHRTIVAIVAALLVAAPVAATAKVPLPKPKPTMAKSGEKIVKVLLPRPRPKAVEAKLKVPTKQAAPEQPRLYACPKRERVGGSCPNVIEAYRLSEELGYALIRNKAELDKAVKLDLLREVTQTDALVLRGVRHPYARPALSAFLGRFSKEYFDQCKEPLVVTSLTRTDEEQPSNASDYSVHPKGMAADFSVHRNTCGAWIEKTLLALEGKGVLDITRERRPAHYHVVIKPKQYEAFIKGQSIAAN